MLRSAIGVTAIKQTVIVADIYTARVIPSVENIDWHRFLGRPPLSSAPPHAIKLICQSPVLITGAGGSIGSALAMRLVNHGQKVVLLESSEAGLYELQCEFADSGSEVNAAFYLGSSADAALVDEIFAVHGPRIVFHAAAFKHVPLLEEQPIAAVANNVLATESLVRAASEHHAQVILLSTDKAVAPSSVMGATKRVAEQIVLASDGTVLRLGNVLASRGSVTGVFARQIAAGGPLTVTDPAARRYFLTIAEAVDLLFAVAEVAHSGALFVPRLHTVHFIADLARFMVETLAPGRDVAIEFTHLARRR